MPAAPEAVEVCHRDQPLVCAGARVCDVLGGAVQHTAAAPRRRRRRGRGRGRGPLVDSFTLRPIDALFTAPGAPERSPSSPTAQTLAPPAPNHEEWIDVGSIQISMDATSSAPRMDAGAGNSVQALDEPRPAVMGTHRSAVPAVHATLTGSSGTAAVPGHGVPGVMAPTLQSGGGPGMEAHPAGPVAATPQLYVARVGPDSASASVRAPAPGQVEADGSYLSGGQPAGLTPAGARGPPRLPVLDTSGLSETAWDTYVGALGHMRSPTAVQPGSENAAGLSSPPA